MFNSKNHSVAVAYVMVQALGFHIGILQSLVIHSKESVRLGKSVVHYDGLIEDRQVFLGNLNQVAS